MFELEDYASGRLTGTVLLFKKEPVEVLSYLYGRLIRVVDLLGREPSYILDIDNPMLEFKPPTVGYINTTNGAKYYSRIPERRWKQGLSRTSVKGLGKDTISKAMFYSEAFLHCLKNEYPSLEEAMELSKKSGRTVAFHKMMAVSPSGYLYFRGVRFGKLNADSFNVKTVLSLLEDSLDEDL